MLVNEKQQYFLVKKSNYRPQRSWAKVMFLQVCVILFTGGSASVHAGIPPPPEQTPPRSRHPPEVRILLECILVRLMLVKLSTCTCTLYPAAVTMTCEGLRVHFSAECMNLWGTLLSSNWFLTVYVNDKCRICNIDITSFPLRIIGQETCNQIWSNR